MKKTRILLAMLLALSVLTFAGCGDNNKAGEGANNGTTIQETTDNAAENLKDDAEDLGNDVKNGAEDMLDGTDNANDGTSRNNTNETAR